MSTKQTVLISYSEEDRSLAEKVVESLRSRNISCWVAFENINPGESWPAAITKAINNCDIFLLILTKHSNNSKQVVRELSQADNMNKILYCFQTENLNISPDIQYFFSSIHRNEAFKFNFETSLKKLTDDISEQLAQSKIKPAYESEKMLSEIRKKVLLAENERDLNIAKFALDEYKKQHPTTFEVKDLESRIMRGINYEKRDIQPRSYRIEPKTYSKRSSFVRIVAIIFFLLIIFIVLKIFNII